MRTTSSSAGAQVRERLPVRQRRIIYTGMLFLACRRRELVLDESERSLVADARTAVAGEISTRCRGIIRT